jgi:hypothetical protein
MTQFAMIVLVAWLPIVLLLGISQRGAKAIVAAFVIAYLALPHLTIRLPGVPDYDKITATIYASVILALFLDRGEIARFRLRFYDLPMILWCVLPFISASENGDDFNECISYSVSHLIKFALPYFIGRIYLNSPQSLTLYAKAFVVGAIFYTPLLLFEHRMGPWFHSRIYGISKATMLRDGGYRPTVFTDNPLECGMFISFAALSAYWLMRTGAVKRILTLPIGFVVLVLVGMEIIEKTTGATLLMCFGIGVLAVSRMMKAKLPMLVILVLPLLYITTRATHTWSGRELVQLSATVSPARAASLETRLINEDQLVMRAEEKNPWGWGRFAGRWRVRDRRGYDVSLTDGLWVITYGTLGSAGLITLIAILLLPPLLAYRRLGIKEWLSPEYAGTVAFACALSLWLIDNLFNAMYNPLYLLAAGGLAGLPKPTPEPIPGYEPEWDDYNVDDEPEMPDESDRAMRWIDMGAPNPSTVPFARCESERARQRPVTMDLPSSQSSLQRACEQAIMGA